MNTFLFLIFLLSFAIIPIYYVSILYLIYYKKIYKNKSNLKFTFTTESFSTYIPVIILAIVSILYVIFIFIAKLNFLLLLIPIISDILVFSAIKLSCTKFNIYDNYIVVKNNYGLYDEIQSVVLEKTNKENTYELKITTKIDLLICTVVTNDSKKLLKDIKLNLPKNIKIKEIPAK